jgi:hypothetical protein
MSKKIRYHLYTLDKKSLNIRLKSNFFNSNVLEEIQNLNNKNSYFISVNSFKCNFKFRQPNIFKES